MRARLPADSGCGGRVTVGVARAGAGGRGARGGRPHATRALHGASAGTHRTRALPAATHRPQDPAR